MRVSAFVVSALCWVSGPVQAQGWSLRHQAPPSCLSSADLARAVEAKLGRTVFSGDAAMRVDSVVEEAAQAPRWRAKLVVVDRQGAVQGSREVTADGASCSALEEPLVLVVSLLVDSAAPLSAPPSPVEAAAPAAPSPPRAAGPTVRVRLDANGADVSLFRLSGTGLGSAWSAQGGTTTIAVKTYSTVCAAPCDEDVAQPRGLFHVGGEGVTPSDEFSLASYPGGVSLKVRPGSLTARLWGGTLMATGVVTAALGLVLTGVSLFSSSRSTGGLTGVGLVSAGVGAALLGAGIPLFRWGNTEVEFLPLSP